MFLAGGFEYGWEELSIVLGCFQIPVSGVAIFLSTRVANDLLLGRLFASFLRLVSSWQTLQFCQLFHFLQYRCGLVSTSIRFFVGQV